MKQVAEDLGVGYVVEGSVRRSGDRVRITAQLNDVATGSHLWAERYDRDLADVFAVQDEITEAIVAAIEPQLYAAENFRAKRKPPDSLDAWDLVMRALSHYWRVTRQDNMVAQALLEKATAIDPALRSGAGCARREPHIRRAYGLGRHGDASPRSPSVRRARRFYADSEDPWAHYALGCVHLFARRFDDSLAEFELALQLNPNFSLAQGYYGLTLPIADRWEEGDLAARRALRLSPRDPFSAIYCGIVSYAQFVGRNYARGDAARARRHPATRRFRRRASRAHGRCRNGRRSGVGGDGAAGTSARPAQYFAGLDRPPYAHQHDRDREHYLEGFRRAGLD